MLIDRNLLDKVTEQAKASERLRMNYNLHDSLEAKAQLLLNALEPGTLLPVHRHCHTAETYIVLRGAISPYETGRYPDIRTVNLIDRIINLILKLI